MRWSESVRLTSLTTMLRGALGKAAIGCHFLSLILACALVTFTCEGRRAQGQVPSRAVTAVVGSLSVEEGGAADSPPSPLNTPFGIDFDAHGNMFIVELTGGRVFRRDPQGELTRIAGNGTEDYSGDGGPAADATFRDMHNVAVTPDGTIYIADSWNHCIRKIDPTKQTITTFAGTGQRGFSGDDGPAGKATFDYVMCITFNLAYDMLYVADLNNRRVRVIDMRNGIVTTVAGNGEQGVPPDRARARRSPLVDPRAVAVDSNESVYILEREGHALRVVTRDGRIFTVAGTSQQGDRDGTTGSSQLNGPKHLCVDQDDNVYVADEQNALIRKYDPRTQMLTTVLGRATGERPVKLKSPHGVCIENGHLYVVDTGNHRVLRLELKP
jgi:DNA-binding beta-propeller fold protein YncE